MALALGVNDIMQRHFHSPIYNLEALLPWSVYTAAMCYASMLCAHAAIDRLLL